MAYILCVREKFFQNNWHFLIRKYDQFLLQIRVHLLTFDMLFVNGNFLCILVASYVNNYEKLYSILFRLEKQLQQVLKWKFFQCNVHVYISSFFLFYLLFYSLNPTSLEEWGSMILTIVSIFEIKILLYSAYSQIHFRIIEMFVELNEVYLPVLDC